MLVYNIQTVNLYHNRTHIFIPRTKRIVNKKDTKRNYTDLKTSYLSIKWLLVTSARRKNKILAQHG